MAVDWKFRITELSVCGFKSISRKQSIKIQPLTILAGANSSGKSAIMQPLLMLKQTLEAQYDPGPLKIDGPNVKFTSTDQFLSRNLESRKLEIEIGAGGQTRLGLTFARGPDAPLATSEQRWTDDDKTHVLRPNDADIVRDRFWLRYAKGGVDEIRDQLRSSFETRVPIAFLQEMFLSVLHVPGIRGNSERTYPVTGTGRNFPGPFQFYVASVIARWQTDNIPLHIELNGDMEHLGLTRSVVARRLNEVELDLLVSRLAEGEPEDLVSVADVGLGVSHVLPVLVALRAADNGQLVYVEEPEIHLHPRAQVKLADILADAAKRGVRVVAETHSTLLLTAIQTLVAKGELAPELVKLHWFQRDARSGVTEVTTANLDENGAFGDWPEDFDDVVLGTDRAYLDAVEGRNPTSV